MDSQCERCGIFDARFLVRDFWCGIFGAEFLVRDFWCGIFGVEGAAVMKCGAYFSFVTSDVITSECYCLASFLSRAHKRFLWFLLGNLDDF